MSLKTFVKISDVSNLSDARYCAGMGVDVLGFRLDPNDPQALDPKKYKSITEWVAGVGFAGEFYHTDPETIAKTVANYNISYIQIQSSNFSKRIIDLDIPIIVEFCLNTRSSLDEIIDFMERSKSSIEFFLFTSENENVDNNIFSKILSLSTKYPLILGCGISKENINSVLNSSSIKGISMKGSAEIKPGFKDYDELADILEELEVE